MMLPRPLNWRFLRNCHRLTTQLFPLHCWQHCPCSQPFFGTICPYDAAAAVAALIVAPGIDTSSRPNRPQPPGTRQYLPRWQHCCSPEMDWLLTTATPPVDSDEFPGGGDDDVAILA
uniref:(northern house mosquito) hypothetical protein n=1 Tax=Culex pipiens TaxID=7175 RepID=A0A8D8MXS1_CULPI